MGVGYQKSLQNFKAQVILIPIKQIDIDIQLMIKILSLVIAAILCSCSSLNLSFKDCNATQFDFFSQFTLGRQNELNQTFDRLQTKIQPLPSITRNSSDLLFRYEIANTTASFYYLDSKQKAEVVGDDIIYISGGKAETKLSFAWSKNQNKGQGTANCLTDVISFAKLLYLDQAFMKFKLGDYINISYYSTPCNITRIDPPLPSQDLQIFEAMINNNEGNNIKVLLQQEIAKYYATFLNQSLYDQKMPIRNTSYYTWIDPTPGKGNLTINYTRLPVGSHLQSAGLSLTFVTQITDDSDWKCGASLPFSPKDVKLYGGLQQFISLSIFQNSLRYAVQKGQLDTLLSQSNWESRVFQFRAGDLYQIIPILASKYYASKPVIGSCKASTTNLKIIKSANSTLLVSMHYACSLSIDSTVISEFDVDPNFVVKVDPQQTYLDFIVVDVNKFAHFKDVGEFQIHDIELANLFLIRSLQQLKGTKVFGSGWMSYTRDYPAIEVEDGILFIYDKAAPRTLE